MFRRVRLRYRDWQARRRLRRDDVFYSLLRASIFRFRSDDMVFNTANFQSAYKERFGDDLISSVIRDEFMRRPAIVRLAGGNHWQYIGPTVRQ